MVMFNTVLHTFTCMYIYSDCLHLPIYICNQMKVEQAQYENTSNLYAHQLYKHNGQLTKVLMWFSAEDAPSVFENKQLVAEDLAVLLGRLSPNETIWNDPDLSKIKMKLEVFMQFLKPIDDCCPLCYNDLSDDDKPLLLSCPTCKNYIHKECAEIWLERKECCTFCKSDIWKHYKEVK